MVAKNTTPNTEPHAFPTRASLDSEDPATVAMALSKMLIDDTRTHMADIQRAMGDTPPPSPKDRSAETYGDHIAQNLKYTLSHIRDMVWHHIEPSHAPEIRGTIDHDIIKQESTTMLASSVAKLGHINEMAGLIARDNVFHHMHEQGVATPGGIKELTERFVDSKTAVNALNKPTFWLTLTAHPTSTNALASIKAQRSLLQAIDNFRRASPNEKAARDAMIDAIHQFAHVPVMPMKGDKTTNLTVQQEIEQGLYFLDNIYQDVPRIYKRYDQPLTEKFGAEYKPEELNLGIKFSSWGSSGDKDGNPNITAETTLQAMVMHRFAAVNAYAKELEAIDHPALAPWKERLKKAHDGLEIVTQKLEMDMNLTHGHIPSAAFDSLSAELKQCTRELNAEAFLQDIMNAYAQTKDKALLDLSRRARIFAFNFGRLEYRETADEYTRIAGLLIPGYAKMSGVKREAAINELLDLPADELQARAAPALAKMQEASNRPYSPDDANPIGYHTLKRMELARDFPDMVTDNVLAECKTTSNFLEALLLQKLAAKEGMAPKLGIVPLFEDGNALEHCVKTVEHAWDNKHYAAHMKELGQTQQVQLAHSDNARRLGMPAARAYIYEAHQKLRALAEKRGVTMQFFEGGSQSDPYRGGIRSMTSTIKEYGIQDFAKFTFQGGDLMNYLNYTPSVMRLFTRIISHCADTIHQRDRKAEATSGLGKHAKAMAEKNETNGTDPKLDDMAIKALKDTSGSYQRLTFDNPQFNEFMKAIGYVEETDAGGATSRPKKRKGGQVDVNDMRTIGFSEALQHAGITPTWIGAGTLMTNLYNLNGRKPVSPTMLHNLYQHSPVFRDATDRILFGLAKTDIEAVKKTPAASNNVLGALEVEYRNAFQVAMEARTGAAYADIVADKHGKAISCTELRDTVINDALPHLKSDLGSKMGYLAIVNNIRNRCLLSTRSIDEYNAVIDRLTRDEKGYTDEKGIVHPARELAEKEKSERDYRTERLQEDASLRRLLHNAGDTVHHGRYLMADDNNYGLFRTALNGVREAIDRVKSPVVELHQDRLKRKTRPQEVAEETVKAELAGKDAGALNAYQVAEKVYAVIASDNGKSRSRAIAA